MKKLISSLGIMTSLFALVVATMSPTVLALESAATEDAADRMKVIAHRGDFKKHGEDTVESQVSAWRKGADCADTDLRITSDHKFIQMHDPTVDRTTDGTGYVHEMTYAEIRELRTTVGNNKIPNLRESLAAAKAAGGCLQVEVMGYFWYVDKVKEMWDLVKEYNMEDRFQAYTTSLNHLRYFEQYTPDLFSIWKATDTNPTVEEARELGVDAIIANNSRLSKGFVDGFHDAGIDVYSSIASSPPSWRRLLDAGCVGVMTNDTVGFLEWYEGQR